ncbi:FAR1 DNA binding domain - like 10 [Theobroma cacao]|nr:FAR1 DNA binding domain - like 10 [Theobroma cacao]WRX22603.1 FAR1 DNA binding domain - like 10 [Theobroma cacao]
MCVMLMENKENNLSDAKYLHELSKDDILSLEFDDLEDVYKFYKAYACAMGFGVRKGSCKRNKDGIEVMKHFACSKEGHRAEKWEKLENRVREAKRSSRTDCKANIRVILNKETGKWYVSHCELEHNHQMVNPAQICFIRSNRQIKVADVCEAKAVKVAGGIQNVGFTRKDFYNRMATERHVEVNDGDVQATLLCSWHLARNAQANIPLPGFGQNFKACMKSWWTIDKFEREWKEMVKKFALQGHQWIDEIYKKKHMWSQSHLSGHFFGTIMSTSHCEGLNTFIASLAKERKTLLEFVRAIEDGIKNIRNNEIGEDYISIHTKPVSSQMFKDIEKHAASVYTGRAFKKFIDEMRLQQLFYHECRFDDEPSIRVYQLMKYGDLFERIRVEFHVDDENIKCSCLKFETDGIPCPHIIHVMI